MRQASFMFLATISQYKNEHLTLEDEFKFLAKKKQKNVFQSDKRKENDTMKKQKYACLQRPV